MRQYIRVDVRFFLLIGLAFLVLVANILFVAYYKNHRVEIKKSYISAIRNEYAVTVGVYADMADSIYHLYLDDPAIKRLFAKGIMSQGTADKDRYRKQLHHELSGVYDRLITYDFRQLHFHEKDNTSYLRMHRPDKYGDDLTGIRPSVAYANREKRYIRGFEEGRIYNGYRFVYPVFLDGEHLGSVEISVSMNTVIRQFSERFDKEAQFIILRSEVMTKVFESEQSNYAAWCVDDNYLLDRAISGQCIVKDRISEKDALKIKDTLSAHENRGTPLCIEIGVDSLSSVLTFLPIRNVTGENVAYIFEIADSKRLTDLDENFYFVFAALSALLILLVVFTVYYRLSQKKIERLAIFDALTGVYARGVLMRMIETEYERYRRYEKPFSLVMIDIDHFKNVNDTYGHKTGDAVLSGVAAVMEKNIRKTDFIGRYGGEEFVVVLPETTKEGAVTVAENLRQAIAAHDFPAIGTVTVSCGVVEMHDEAQSVEALIDESDKKLYTAKRNGRNRVEA